MQTVNIDLPDLFSALSDRYRLRIIRLLLEAKNELCLCDFSEALNEPEYKLSRHIKILKNAGLLKSVRDGKWIYHSLVRNHDYLKAIYKAISLFPDTDIQAQADLTRYKKRSLRRSNGRCTGAVRPAEPMESRA